MSNNQNTTEDVIDLRIAWHRIKEKKKLFFIVLPIVLVVSSIIILCVPRTYSTDTTLAPELNIPTAGGSLSDLASSFGIDLGDRTSTDAIYPTLYPDLMEDNGFVANLFNIRVKSQDGTIDTTYYTYLNKYQKKAWWNKAFAAAKKLFPKKEDNYGSGGKGQAFNPYYTSKKVDMIMEAIRNNINISVDKKTDVITIKVKAQDPLICKTVADSVRMRLQAFITEYRTHKARLDVEYYTKLTADAKAAYEKVRRKYAASADANMDALLESAKSVTEDLENDMQLKYNNYTAMQTQLQAARAKLRENTPAFTIIKGASVPVKASGPKRMVFVAMMTILAFLITLFIIVRKDLHFNF